MGPLSSTRPWWLAARPRRARTRISPPPPGLSSNRTDPHSAPHPNVGPNLKPQRPCGSGFPTSSGPGMWSGPTQQALPNSCQDESPSGWKSAHQPGSLQVSGCGARAVAVQDSQWWSSGTSLPGRKTPQLAAHTHFAGSSLRIRASTAK